MKLKKEKIKKEKVKKEKKKSDFKIFVVLMLIWLLFIGGTGFFLWKYIKGGNGTARTATVLDEVKTNDGYDYGYSLTDLDSDYYKAEFKNLKDILTKDTIDEEAYATQLAKCFAIDLYTLSTKMNKYDVGGKEFYYTDKQEEFGKAVMNGIYDTMPDNTYGDRKQELPEVKSVEVKSTEKTQYLKGNEVVDGYLVKMNITYKGVKADTALSVVIVKDDKKLSVIDSQNTLSPKYEATTTKKK